MKVPYQQQGLIYFTCRTYADQPKDIRDKIDSLCACVGGEYERALFAVLTSPKSIRLIALDEHVSESTLYKLRRRFYESWKSV